MELKKAVSKLHAILPRPALLLMAWFCAVIQAASPVLSTMQLHGSNRGLILVLGADGPFDLTASLQKSRTAAAASSVLITAKGLIYGLEESTFETFPKESPVKAIAVRENTKTRMVEIVLKMAIPLSQAPRAKAREKGWLVLLSETPVETFFWDATGALAAESSAGGAAATSAGGGRVAKSAVVSPAAEISPSATKAKRPALDSSVGAFVRLLDIRRVRRGSVENITFILDKDIHWVAKRQDGQMVLGFENAVCDAVKAQYDFSDSPIFASLKLSTAQRGASPWLIANVALHTNGDGAFIIVMSSLPTMVTISAELSDTTPQLSAWSASRGTLVAYRWKATAGVAPTDDHPSLRAQAEKDSRQPLSEEQTFFLTERASPAGATPPAVTEPPIAQSPADIKAVSREAEAPASNEYPPALAAAPLSKEIIVVKDKVNLRSLPAIHRESRIMAQLAKGTRAIQIGQQGEWLNVETSQGSGWIHRSLAQEVAPIPPSTPLLEQVQPKAVKTHEMPVASPRSPEPPPMDSFGTGGIIDTIRRTEIVGAADTASVRRSVTIVYHNYGRDPFLPLEYGKDDSIGLPPVDRLRLVGILYDETDRVALFEDTKLPGRAYALREADPVQNGKVLQIQENSVVFLVTEFDISRTVTLRLAKPPLVSRSEQREEGGEESVSPGGHAGESTASGSSTTIPAWAQPKQMLQRQQETISAAAAAAAPSSTEKKENISIRRRGGWAATK